MLGMAGSSRHYLTEKRAQFNPLRHLIFPVAGTVLFAFPLYYQYFPLPPYPIRYAVWIALGWVIAGLVLGTLVWRRNPQALKNAELIYVEDETVAGAPEPGGAPSPA